MRKIKMPSYEYIKSLSTVDSDDEDCYKDYSWILFETLGTTGMLSYNKGDEKTLYFYVEGDNIDFYSFEASFDEEGYKKLCEHVKIIFKECYELLETDSSIYWNEDDQENAVEIQLY